MKTNITKKLQKFYTNRPVLVTGGAGFIGSYIIDLLVQHNAKVTVLDNLTTGTLNNIIHNKNVIEFVKGSICDKHTCNNVIKENSIIFHCAAEVSVPQSLENPDSCFTTNCVGLNNILEAARNNNASTLIFSSSSAVYGPNNNACSETSPCAPISPYGYSKYIGEHLCQQYAKIYNLGTLCLRYFNVYGQRQNPQGPYAGIMAKLHDCIKKNTPFTIFGDGKQTRDFVPVEDVAYYNILCPLLPKKHLNGQAYNCATGSSISIKEIVQRTCSKYPDYSSPIEYKPARVGDIMHSAAVCTKLHELIKCISHEAGR